MLYSSQCQTSFPERGLPPPLFSLPHSAITLCAVTVVDHILHGSGCRPFFSAACAHCVRVRTESQLSIRRSRSERLNLGSPLHSSSSSYSHSSFQRHKSDFLLELALSSIQKDPPHSYLKEIKKITSISPKYTRHLNGVIDII